MITDYVGIIFRSLLHRKVRSWLTMLGIFIGIAAVVSLISLGQGLEKAMTQVFADLGTDKLIIQAASTGFGPPGSLAAVPLTKDDVELARQASGVKLAVGRILQGVTAAYDDKTAQNFAINLPEDLEERNMIISALNLKLAEGRLLRKGDKFSVVLGNDFSGDSNQFQHRFKLHEKVAIEGKDFEVVGILKRVGAPFGNDAMLIMEDTLRDLINEQEEVDVITVQVETGVDIKKVAQDLEKKFRKKRNQKEGEEDFTVQTPEQVGKAFNTILAVVQGVVIGIAAISLFVGGVGITNTMFTAVLERTREIGIMKAIGAKNSDIAFLFMAESGLLGMAGGIIGVVLGAGLSLFIEYVGTAVFGSQVIKASLPWYLLAGALLFSFAVGTLSGIVPALRAAHMHPVEALRK